ncbi:MULTISPECIES: tRNA (adenine-N1)-methyltransferase [Arsenicicoccus]|uniref:tRNA (adenine-N1)-methyltransferase n=1 Tax=Arsenicicoccus TaxID=267408 RepID=UPI002580D1C8|nr:MULTISPECIES: tRNA (adenine-N1)-methyltransferase [Arsenicicoccus]
MRTQPDATAPLAPPQPTGAAGRRGPFQPGERVQLTDARGRMHTITLAVGGEFHTHRGRILHDVVIGLPDGSTLTNTAGEEFLALRPLLSDYVMSMPRGAAVVYPKDAGQIVQYADIFPGATVVEAGVGSGALSMSLLRAIGDQGRLLSFERRADFAEIARGNARTFFGTDHPAWTVTVGDLAETLPEVCAPGTVDRVVLDMLAPWECLKAVADALVPGGLLICYVATATQLSRVAEGAKEHGGFTEPHAWETIERDWHLEGLAVRPVHRMHGHTGFLITTRRLAPGVTPPLRKRRPAKGPDDPEEQPFGVEVDREWSPEDVGERVVSDKRLRKIRRTVTGEAPPPDMPPKRRDADPAPGTDPAPDGDPAETPAERHTAQDDVSTPEVDQ